MLCEKDLDSIEKQARDCLAKFVADTGTMDDRTILESSFAAISEQLVREVKAWRTFEAFVRENVTHCPAHGVSASDSCPEDCPWHVMALPGPAASRSEVQDETSSPVPKFVHFTGVA